MQPTDLDADRLAELAEVIEKYSEWTTFTRDMNRGELAALVAMAQKARRLEIALEKIWLGDHLSDWAKEVAREALEAEKERMPS